MLTALCTQTKAPHIAWKPRVCGNWFSGNDDLKGASNRKDFMNISSGVDLHTINRDVSQPKSRLRYWLQDWSMRDSDTFFFRVLRTLPWNVLSCGLAWGMFSKQMYRNDLQSMWRTWCDHDVPKYCCANLIPISVRSEPDMICAKK